LKHNSFFLSSGEEIVLFNQKIKEKNEIVSNIKNYNDRNSVELLLLKKLFVLKNDLPKLQENEYYLDDLSNLIVFDKEKNKLGKVLSALDYGAGTFLDIRLENGKTATLPFRIESVLSVDIGKRFIVINEDFLLI
jgi:16S rRNA processing protein RimM